MSQKVTRTDAEELRKTGRGLWGIQFKEGNTAPEFYFVTCNGEPITLSTGETLGGRNPIGT